MIPSTLTSRLWRGQSFDPTLRKLNVGCGNSTPAGWLNTDNSWHMRLSKVPLLKNSLLSLGLLPGRYREVQWARNTVFLDISRPLPFEDERFDAVYASHVLEHLFLHQVRLFLTESHRIISRGGNIRIIVPDLDIAVTKYMASIDKENDAIEASEKFLEFMHVIPDPSRKVPVWIRLARGEFDKNLHKWVYNRPMMARLLEDAGFTDIRQCLCGESAIEDIVEIDNPGRFENAFCLEATRAS